MVKLPLKKDFSPITSKVPSIVALMGDINSKQKELSSIVGTIDSVASGFSDDLVTVSNTIDSLASKTGEIAKRLDFQQNVLTSLQNSSSSTTKTIIGTLESEVNNLKNIASTVSDHANVISNTISKGLNLGTVPANISKQINTVVKDFSSTANKLTSALEGHATALTSVIKSSEKTISGIITNSKISGEVKSVQNMLKDGKTSKELSVLGKDITKVEDQIGQVTRLASQKFTDISNELSNTLGNLKSSIVAPMTARISSHLDFKKITNNVDGSIANATNGLNKLTEPMKQLGDVSSKIGSLTSNISSKLSAIEGQTTNSFNSAMGKLNEITGKMETLGAEVNSQVSSLTNTMTSAVNSVGGMNPLTGVVGGVSSITDIVNPAKTLSSSITDMNNLSHDLILHASSLEQFAEGFPANNPITQFTTKVAAIGQQIYNHTSGTADPLTTLANETAEPHLTVGSIEQTITNTGKDLTSKQIPDVALHIDIDKMTKEITTQVLTLNNSTTTSTPKS